jgi:hypothetical protein
VGLKRIDQNLAAFEQSSLLHLLGAAADSPGCSHRSASLAVLWHRTCRARTMGGRPASPDDLGALLASAREGVRRLSSFEDCWNPDPRLDVCFPIANVRLRVHPGGITSPIQALRTMARLSELIDAALIEAHGFGFLDLLEAALRYSDARLTALRPVWPKEGLARDDEEPTEETIMGRVRRIQGAPAMVTEGEVESWELYDQGERPWVDECQDAERASLAWDWATRDISETRWSLGIDTHIFGSALAFRRGDASMPVPTAFVLGSLCSALGELSAQISASGPYDLIIRKAVAIVALAAIGGTAPEVPVSGEDHLDWLASSDVLMFAPSKRRAVAVGFAAGLTHDQLSSSIDVASEQLAAAVDEPPDGAPQLDPDATVSQLIVYGGPIHIEPRYGRGPIAIHVEEFIDMLSEARQAERDDDVGGILWWQFIEEASGLPGVREVLSTGIENVWHHWIRHGVLNIGGRLDVALFVAPEVDDRRWALDAMWEPFEEILHAAGFPPRALWPMATLVEDGREVIVGDLQVQWTVNTSPPIVIGAFPAESSQEPLIDQGSASGIADGLLLTIRGSEILRDAFGRASGLPVLLGVRLGLVDVGGSPGISLREVGRTCPGVIVNLEPSWQRLLALQPQRAHEALGDVLCEWIDEVSIGAPDVEALKRAWRTTAPVIILRPVEGSPPPRQKGNVTLPRNVVSQGKAMQIVARKTVKYCEFPVIATGAEAIRLATDELAPLVTQILVELVHTWSPDSIVDVAEHLNDAFAERYRIETEIGLALSAPWAETWRERVRSMTDPAKSTRPLDLLFEALLAADVQGSATPDQFDIAVAVDLADLLFGIGASAWGAIRGMHDLVVAISADGLVAARAATSDDAARFGPPSGPKELEFDVVAFQDALRAHELAYRVSEEPLESDDWIDRAKSGSTTTERFETLDSFGVIGRFREADQALRQAVGTGIDGIAAVLATAVDLRSGDDRASVVEPRRLLDEAREWSGLDASIIDSAIALLTLGGGLLANEEKPFWEQEARKYRLSTRPLVVLSDGSLLIIPWRVRAAQQVYSNYLLSGSLPWQRSHLPTSVDDAFNRYRQVLNQDLERLAEQVAIDLGFKCFRNVTIDLASKAGLTLGGEIDLLVADGDLGRIWVCEVKDPTSGFSASTIRKRIQRFKGDGGHEAQLKARTSDVQADRHSVCRLLGAEEQAKPWDVVPLMITRRPEAAAFVAGTPVAYAVIEQLPRVWRAAMPNGSGYVSF